MSERKPCVLEGATPGAETDESGRDEAGAAAHPSPCALLSAAIPCVPAHTDPAENQPEDESADPVGDGHSDAEWAAAHPRGSA